MDPIHHCPVPLTDTAWRRLLRLASAEYRSPAAQAGLLLAAALDESPPATRPTLDNKGWRPEGGRVVVQLDAGVAEALKRSATAGNRSARQEAARLIAAGLDGGAAP